jgi:transcriptional regulator with XRE-family HTH domain
MLRELKTKKGSSFEALARRIGVSKSALHRYTAGEAVPARFSIVEMWARTCGATPAEIGELRRLWQMAVEEQPTAATAEPAPPEPEPEPEPELAPAVESAPAPRRRPRIVPAVSAVAVAGMVAVGVTLVRDGGATSVAQPLPAASDTDPMTQNCEARAGVRHVDARRSGHVWRTDYVCPNTAGAVLYDEPGGSHKIAVMETERSWFTCWAPAPAEASHGTAIWYYTRGDRSEPGTEAWDGWGFVPAEHVGLEVHPAPSMPGCWFNPGAE